MKAVYSINDPEPEVIKLFRMVVKHDGSELFLKVGLPPMIRLKGAIRRMEMRPLSQEDMKRLLYPMLTAKQKLILNLTGAIDFADVVDQVEFRVSLFQRDGGLGLVARSVEPT